MVHQSLSASANSCIFPVLVACILNWHLTKVSAEESAHRADRPLAPLPELSASLDPKKVKLGKKLFFDGRLSGDATISCASCHMPSQAWCEGLELSGGYPGTLYFRNTPTIANVVHAKHIYWDGRLPANDLATVVRDHISEAHFMQADGRLVIERIRQVPEYESGFREAFGGEPSYGRILNAVSEFVKSIRSTDVPFDLYLSGNEAAISDEARRGLELFRGKAYCVSCHNGPMLSDNEFHNLGLPANPRIFSEPQRHITFRRFMRTLGISEYASLQHDVGAYCVTKQKHDQGRFRTPTLREVSRTAPYMHDGSLATLKEVVEFYNRGGGTGPNKDPALVPLDLGPAEQRYLVAFLKTLSGKLPDGETSPLPPYELRTRGEN